MPNSARPGGALSKARLQRSAQRERQPHRALDLGSRVPAAGCIRRAASRCRRRAASGSRSRAPASARCIEPSICERNVTPLLVELAQLRQRHHLEAAGIGEDRPRPVHELVQAAERRDRARRRAAASGDRCCRARCRRRCRAPLPACSPFTVACVPTGMKAGVRISPCGVVDLAARAPRRRSRAGGRRRRRSCRPRSEQQAGIAIGIEPIARRDRMRVGALHRVEPAEGRDQHEQRRARQMEIGQQHVDRPEAIARRDEDRGVAGERPECCRPSSAALSSSRSAVVPTATMRPPLARAALSASAVSARRPRRIRHASCARRCRRPSPAGTCRRRHAASRCARRRRAPRAAPSARR